MQSRAWCFTINNHTYEDLYSLVCMPIGDGYMIFGFEEVSTPHIQGYVKFRHCAQRLSFMKEHLPRAHLEVARGTAEKNIEYCSKEGEWYEFGERPHQGQLGREQVRDLVTDPYSNLKLFNQYRNTIQDLREYDYKNSRTVRRVFAICPQSQIYDYLRYYVDHGYTCCVGLEYNMEDIYVCNDTISTFAREDKWSSTKFTHEGWYRGLPSSYKMGYRIIPFDPLMIVTTYTSIESYNKLIKMIPEYISSDHSITPIDIGLPLGEMLSPKI